MQERNRNYFNLRVTKEMKNTFQFLCSQHNVTMAEVINNFLLFLTKAENKKQEKKELKTEHIKCFMPENFKKTKSTAFSIRKLLEKWINDKQLENRSKIIKKY